MKRVLSILLMLSVCCSVSWGCGSYADEDGEQLLGKWEETEEVLSSDKEDPPENYEAPCVSEKLPKIGRKFSSFHVSGTGLQYDPGSLMILLKQRYPFNSPGQGAYYESWDAYTDYNGFASKIGVYNDKIVFSVVDYSSQTKVQNVLSGGMIRVKPLIIYGYDSNYNVVEQMLIWKCNNGYFVGFAEARGYPNGSYLNERFLFSITTVDLMHINGIPQEVRNANPAF